MTTLAPQNTTVDDHGFPDTYDQEGAMQYIVSTVCVYALLGVCSMLCARIKRKGTEASRSDEEMGRYLKMEKKIDLEAHRQKLMQHRKKMAMAILQRHEINLLQRISEFEEGRSSDMSGTESYTSIRSALCETTAVYSETTGTENESPMQKLSPYIFPVNGQKGQKSPTPSKSMRISTTDV
jgi:K+-sensing histidine kinase KdpD